MVAAVYVRLAARATRLIAKYGKPAQVVRTTRSGPPHAPTSAVTTDLHDCRVADLGYSITNRDQTLIQVGDKVGMMSTAVNVVPTLTDRIRIDGADYRIIDLQPLNPGGLVLLFEYVART